MSSEATQTTTVYDVLAWVETNKKALVGAFVVAVVVGFGISIYRYNSEKKELTASDALLKLKASMGATESTNQTDPAAYLRVAEQYAGTSAAERALLLAGTAFFTQGKYAEAQGQFNRFLRDNAQAPFAATAAYGVAACLEAQGKQDDALTAYQGLAVRYPNSNIIEDSKLAIARIYEAKKQPEQALRTYDEVVKSSSMGSGRSEASLLREALLAKHPELAKTNAPAAPLMPSPTVMSTNNRTTVLPAASSTNAPAAAATNRAPATR